MKYYKNTIRIIIFLLFGTIYAQQEPNYSLYRYTMNVINPAYAGADGTTNITANLKSQWVGVKDSPETQSLFFATPVGKRVGLGISMVNDRTFIEKQTSINIDFSYELPISESTKLFLGLKAGGSTYDIDRDGLSNLPVFSTDPALDNIDNSFNPNFGLGGYLLNDKYFVSLSVPSILKTDSVDNDSGKVTYATKNAHIYLSGGYNFDINSNIEFRPSTLIKYVDGAPVSVNLTAGFRFFEKFELAAAYRTDEAIAGMFVLDLAEWVKLGYAYDSSMRSEISNLNNGTHEILIRFNFKSK